MAAKRSLDHQAILRNVIDVVRMIIDGRDSEFSGGIGPDTHLVHDLDCDSQDFVAFGLELEIRFGRRDLPVERLMMVDGRYRDDLSVSEVVLFLEKYLNHEGAQT